MVVGGHPGGFGQSLYQARRDDEHQLGLIGLELGAAGQRAENRYLSQSRKALDGFGDIVLMRPAMTRLCPSLSCTVVSARLTVRDGITEVTPLMEVKGEPVCDRSETSDTNLRLTRELPSTVGVNLTPMPNSFLPAS